MDCHRQAQVLEYMREDPESERAKGNILAAVNYLENAGVADDYSEAYLMAVKTLALSFNDGVPIQKEGNRIISQLELQNIGSSW